MSDVEEESCNLAQPAPPGGEEKVVEMVRRSLSPPSKPHKKKKDKKRHRDLADDEASEDNGEEESGDDGEEGGSSSNKKKKKPKKKLKKKPKSGREKDSDAAADDDNEDGGFDLDVAASFSNDDLKEEMLQHALNSGLAMGASASSEERCGLAARKWDWEAKVTAEDFCFLCLYGELTSQSSNHSDSCAELVNIFESNFGKASDKAVCMLVQESYNSFKKDVPNQPEWSLESIMHHFITDAPTDAIMAIQSKRVAHHVTLACYKEMGIRSKKTNKVRLNIEIVKLYLAVNKISQSAGGSGWKK